MNRKIKIAFLCYLLAMAGPALFGVMFMVRSEFMPYHAEAVGMRWPEVPRPFQTLIMALLKLAGGAWLTVAVAELVLPSCALLLKTAARSWTPCSMQSCAP